MAKCLTVLSVSHACSRGASCPWQITRGHP
jgi:hypothetical protein